MHYETGFIWCNPNKKIKLSTVLCNFMSNLIKCLWIGGSLLAKSTTSREWLSICYLFSKLYTIEIFTDFHCYREGNMVYRTFITHIKLFPTLNLSYHLDDNNHD